MKSIRIQLGIIPILACALVVAACGGTTGTGAASPSPIPALIHTASLKVGDKTVTVLKNAAGLTLYYLTSDSAIKIGCTGACASNWPPLLATSGTPTSNPALPGELTVLNGPNGNQVLYNGHPLYAYIKDKEAGDVFGQGVGGKWFVATPDLAAAVAASSTPIY
jgi:predicted lipoprotein with Yx(FWY)xxD motif